MHNCTHMRKGEGKMDTIIDTGGGLRGIYGAGVLDRCLDENIRFDLCIGISAGSANVASFLAKQKGRNYRFHTIYSQRPEYMSLQNLVKSGYYIDLDYVYGVLSEKSGEDPLDFQKMQSYDGRVLIPVTDQNGNSRYMTMDDIEQDDYHALHASSSLPFVCKPYKADSGVFFDGGIADPIPIEKALQEGSGRSVVILTRPVDFLVRNRMDTLTSVFLRRKYPGLAQALLEHAARYKRSLAIAKELERKGQALIIAPDDCCGVETLTKDTKKLHALYEKGYADGEKIKDFLK